MNQVDQNINKDMSDFDLLDLDSLDFSDKQTWLYKVPDDSGKKLDVLDWYFSLDWPDYKDEEYQQTEQKLHSILDEVLKSQVLAMPDKHKFDSRTYVMPKKRSLRPSIQNIVESPSPQSSLTVNPKNLTYNKYNTPLGVIQRLKTFTLESNAANGAAIKEALKRRSLVQDEDPQLEDGDTTLISNTSDRLSAEHTPARPINIDLSQPAHNIHNTFNKGLSNIMNERGSLNMYQSGESLMRMSPPSLVSSLLMDSSGHFNQESMDNRKSISSHRDSGLPTTGRDSIDPMMTSMTLSILDEKDMNTSFLSQTTYPDNDSFMDSLPPSLVSSVNSSYVVSNHSKPKDSVESNNIFSSATFTHLEQSEKLLSARPRCQPFNNFTKREAPLRSSESYTKAKEEACQIDVAKILSQNLDKNDRPKPGNEMSETITLHFANNKYKPNNAEKENLNASFERDDTFFKDMGMQRNGDTAKNSLNVTLDKQELNEIIQARQKLSLARRALPNEADRPLPNQVDASPVKPIPNQTITVPKKSMENASELLARRRALANGYDRPEDYNRETPKRNLTFKRVSPKTNATDSTVVYVNPEEQTIIDINSATMKLIDDERALNEEWGSDDRAMVGSSESTDTGTFSSSSPPDSVPDTTATQHPRSQVASTPLALRKGAKVEMLNLHNTISPIYDTIDDKSYVLSKTQSNGSNVGYEGSHTSTTVINTGTIVKKNTAKRDILAGKVSPEKKMFGPSVQQKSPPAKLPTTTVSYVMAAPMVLPRKTGLPTSKLRQYSSHKELRIPVSTAGSATSVSRVPSARTMVRRNVYASNPALSPTAPAPPPIRRDSYTIAADQKSDKEVTKPTTAPPALVRQGTETLRRERPQSQLVQPKDLRAGPGSSVPVSMRPHHGPPPTSRPYSIAGSAPQRVTMSRQSTVPPYKITPAPSAEYRPTSAMESRVSALPRPSRLPAPRRGLRPPSVYSVAPTADMDNY